LNFLARTNLLAAVGAGEAAPIRHRNSLPLNLFRCFWHSPKISMDKLNGEQLSSKPGVSFVFAFCL
jgi:hypothetical protein